MQSNLILNIQDLHKSYGSVRALRGVNLQVQQGELFGFLGPNGAGKTTTIRCLLDLIRPDKGSISIFGLDPQKEAVKVKELVGYLPGELHIEHNQRVGSALRYFAQLRGNNLDWSEVKVSAKRLELDLDLPVKNLSKGNKQKVGILIALMGKPKLLLLDEPTSGLDPLMQQVVYEMLREAQAAGSTVFFSSHILSEVEALANRVAIIRKGRIAEEVDPRHLGSMSMQRVKVRFAKPVPRADFSDLPGIQLLDGTNDQKLRFQVEGSIDPLVKALAKHKVLSMETSHLTLEEIFLAYYKNGNQEEQA